MKKNTRDYKFSDGLLLSVCRQLKGFVSRDMDAFASYGFTAATPNDLQTRMDAFEAMPTDTELEQIQAESTAFKLEKEAQLKAAIREISTRGKLLWGEASPKYKRFGNKGLDNMKDAELSVCGKRVADVATDLLSELSVRGVNQVMIDATMAAKAAFDEAVSAQGKKMSERGIIAEERIVKGNGLYALTITLADTGKAIWFGKNEGKYKDYVLYTESGSPVAAAKTVTPA